MVQVDIFWSYAIGASFAAAACRQLQQEEQPFQNKYFTYTLFYLACFFAPSGIYLLWNFPHWETMHVARSHLDLPAWLVVLFAITNVTQGLLGFYICYRLIRRGRYYAAHLQWYAGYFCMFFILLYGWDGTGWQRFLYDPTFNQGKLWQPGLHDGPGFLVSNVALTLYAMGVIIIPLMLIPISRWVRDGALADPHVSRDVIPDSASPIMRDFLIGVFGFGLGSAAIAALFVHFIHMATGNVFLGFLLGLPLFIFPAYYFCSQRTLPIYSFFQHIFFTEPDKAD